MAIIFDIQRSSVHDGPGIRTTVFFKGCPLSCKWCHNPESRSPHPQLAFFREKCVFCGNCVPVCKEQVHTVADGIHNIDYPSCTTSGACITVCPAQALKIYGEEVSAQEIMDTVIRDKAYFNVTGGGLTVSGGEPFFQFDALIELLILAKQENIHTCVDTSGFATKEQMIASAKWTDLFLFDCKETDPVHHKSMTGVDNTRIVDNFNALYEAGASMILRCPIIPGYNDNDRHLRNVANAKRKYPRLAGVEILLYHHMGRSKADAIGVVYEVENGMPTAEECEQIKVRLASFGADDALLDSF